MRSLWLQEALGGAEEDAPRLEGDEKADVCIVGGGYTGLWTAIRLKEHDPALDVVLVEGDVCGGGPSGRNGGFVLSWWAKFAKLEHIVGADEALRLCRASAGAVEAIGGFCSANGIDAHFRHDGWLWAATSAAQIGAWEETVAAIERHGEQVFERLEPEEVARRAGSPTHLAGVLEQSGATVQPALLARGLRRVALERGVRIFERSPMTRLERSRPPRVHTPGGIVTAERVVLAMNAWLAQIGELSRSIFVLASDMVATERVPERLAEIGLTRRRRDLRLAPARQLLPHHARRPDRVRPGWGPDRQGRPDRPGLPRRRATVARRGGGEELSRALPDAGRRSDAGLVDRADRPLARRVAALRAAGRTA